MKHDKDVESNIVAKVTKPDGEEKIFAYPTTSTSGFIVQDSTSQIQGLGPEYIEQITEVVDRGRGLLDSGIKFSLKLPEKLGGGGIEFEKKPLKEIRTITKVIYRKP